MAHVWFSRRGRLSHTCLKIFLPGIRGRGQILRDGVQIFALGRGVVKNSPGRGLKLLLQGGGRVGGKYKNATKFLKETKETAKKVAVLAA